MGEIHPIVMPKWGLAMQEGTVVTWQAVVGDEVSSGQEILEIETSKIASVHESPASGPLRRIVVQDGETVPVGALLGVLAPTGVPDEAVDAYVQDFLDNFDFEAAGEDTGPTDEILEASGRRIQFIRQGESEGPPILFIHGFGGDRLGWMFNQGALAETHSTYAIDLPGHGGSTKDVGDGSIGFLSDAVAAFMDAAGIERVHIVGHSMGGAIALSLALRRTERVASATLLAPAGIGREINMDFIDGFISQSRARKLRGVLEMLVAEPGLVTSEMIEEVVRFKRLDGVAAALSTLKEGVFPAGRQRPFSAEELLALKPPTQVIWGEKDRILPVAHADTLPDSIPVLRLPDAGHLPHMEQAAAVNDAIRQMVT